MTINAPDKLTVEPPKKGGSNAVSVIVPTYQEVQSLPPLIDRLASLRSSGWEVELVIVDDDSQDGTTSLIKTMDHDWIRLLVRTHERGLSTAVMAGLDEASHECLIVMDADLSHPPESIPEFVAALDDGADFVIGSRYVSGGSTEDGWGVLRWVNSKVATVMARPFTKVKDPMSGFLGLHRQTWRAAEALDPIGYKIGLELIVKCRCRHVVEVPIHFSTRRHGESKLTLGVQRDYLLHILRLARWKYPERSSFIPFAIVGASGIGIYAALLAILGNVFGDLIGMDLVIIASILLTMCWNFALDRKLAFWWAKGRAWLQLLGFVLVCAVPVLVNFWVTRTFAYEDNMATPLAGVIGAAIGSALGILFNWGASRLFIFSR